MRISKEDLFIEYYNDIFVLDLDAMRWSKAITDGAIPSKRYGHTDFMIGNQIVFEGGWGRHGIQKSDCDKDAFPMFSLNLETNEFTEIKETRPDVWRTSKSSSKLHRLTNRYGHTCSAVGNVLVIFGGWDGQQALSKVELVELKN